MEIDSESVMIMDDNILSARQYDRLEPILQEINKKFVRISGDVRTKNVRCFKKCRDDMILRMKDADQTFSDLYQDIRFTGSYYEGSRVHEPNEFDINLALRVPFKVTIQDDCTTPGYVRLKVAEQNQSTSQNRDQYRWVENGFVSAQAVIRWLEGVISKVFHKAGAAGSSITVEDMYSVSVLTKSGPAITLRMQDINAESSVELIDVDFVPIFEFQYPTYWPQKTRPFPDLCRNTVWFVTPKVEKNPIEWRLSFSDLEKDMMHNKINVKNAYRLLKWLRDCSVNLKHIKSYHIKTIFLWKVNQLESSECRKSLGRLFMMMLFELENCLHFGEIPFFWDRRMNTIKRLRPELVDNMCMQIAHIRGNIDRLLSTNDIQAVRRYMYECMSKSHSN